eukprot:TRINITY_DN6216_c0_g1_i1.p3 TRINITY_DN6216_c0_g1~~TRINITY_DN6216_c0_g1_i1.p3  ORF type:complete len:106 (+),score=23.74 TRINITY_DN6216_c0_g1_i1:45-320(+)
MSSSSTSTPAGLLSPDTYTAFYCEENIYRLVQRLTTGDDDTYEHARAVFVSNPDKRVPFFKMRASSRPDGLCVWDYHVVCIAYDKRNQQWV